MQTIASILLVALLYQPTAAALASAPQVKVTAYTESLCPDTIHFITKAWFDVWNLQGVGYGQSIGDGQGIISWNQVVWGNAHIDPAGNITCQHGPNECKYNILHNCAIALSNTSQWLPFVYCLESSTDQGRAFAQCAQKWLRVPDVIASVQACWTSELGQDLVRKAGVRTQALSPAHTFVPWVTLSDAAGTGTFCADSNCDNFLAAVCKAYMGTKPQACSQTRWAAAV